jgi:hypothetical protein
MLLKTADTFEETSIALDRMLAALVPAVTWCWPRWSAS